VEVKQTSGLFVQLIECSRHFLHYGQPFQEWPIIRYYRNFYRTVFDPAIQGSIGHAGSSIIIAHYIDFEVAGHYSKIHNWVNKNQREKESMMVELKEMPYSEKYTNILDNMRIFDTFVPLLVQKHLGDQAVVELQRIWREGFKPIPEDAPFEEKYEIAYGNYIWQGQNSFSFTREKLGEEGIEQFKRVCIEALKRKNAGPASAFLKLVRALSPGLAFTMMARQMSYWLQWLTPYSISELTRDKAVVNIPRCKVLDFHNSDDMCVIGCQIIYPMFMAEQFKVRMKPERQENSCTITLTRSG
jgi:hypothetical protein